MGCRSNSCFAAFSRPTVALTSCLQYLTSSTSTPPLGLWSNLPGIPNSLHPVFSEYDLLRSAQSRVRTSRNRALGQSFTRLVFFPGSDIGARVEWIIAVLLLSALMTTRGKNLFALSLPVFGLRHCDRISDHPPFLAASQSKASCQGRSKTRPLGRSKTRPVQYVEERRLSGRRASGAEACAARKAWPRIRLTRSEEHTSELQSPM